MLTLDGRVALVTGAQQGIGKAIAEAIGRAGGSVVVQFLDDQEAAEQIVETCLLYTSPSPRDRG